MSREELEKKYKIRILPDGDRQHMYKIVSADGCPWENGLFGLSAVEEECERWKGALLDIARRTKR